MPGKVLFVVAQQSFRDEELFETRAALERAGYTVVVASHALGFCAGMRGGHVEATIALAEVHPRDYESIVFIGGNGAHAFFDDPDAARVAREAHAARRILGAICIAPTILARAGLLKKRRATAFSSELEELRAHGAEPVDHGVVIDGPIVTASGPREAAAFGAALLRALSPRGARITTRPLRRVVA